MWIEFETFDLNFRKTSHSAILFSTDTDMLAEVQIFELSNITIRQ